MSKVKESRMNTVLPFGVLSGLATWPFNAVQHDAISLALEDDPCTHAEWVGQPASCVP